MGYFLQLVKGEKFFLCKDVYKVLEKKENNEYDNCDKWPFCGQISDIAEPIFHVQMNLKVIRMHFRLKAAGEERRAAGEENYIPNKSIEE